jgi:hypothetical protein
VLSRVRNQRVQRSKSFLVLFFKKEQSFLLAGVNPTVASPPAKSRGGDNPLKGLPFLALRWPGNQRHASPPATLPQTCRLLGEF